MSLLKMDQKVHFTMDQKLHRMEARARQAFHRAETLVNEVKYLEQPVEKMKKRVSDNDGNNMLTDQWEWDVSLVGNLYKSYMTKAELEIKLEQGWDEDENDYFRWFFEQPGSIEFCEGPGGQD
jgi:hypothetical protein